MAAIRLTVEAAADHPTIDEADRPTIGAAVHALDHARRLPTAPRLMQ